jgi:hypothetical protein
MQITEFNCTTGLTTVRNMTPEEIASLPPSPSLSEAKASRIKYINAEADKAFAQILAPYPAHEVSTWPNQYAEALALQSDPNANTPTLAGIALVSGETVAVIAAAVLTKAAAYTAASGQIVGKRKLKTTQIEDCLTNAEVEAITW